MDIYKYFKYKKEYYDISSLIASRGILCPECGESMTIKDYSKGCRLDANGDNMEWYRSEARCDNKDGHASGFTLKAFSDMDSEFVESLKPCDAISARMIKLYLDSRGVEGMMKFDRGVCYD